MGKIFKRSVFPLLVCIFLLTITLCACDNGDNTADSKFVSSTLNGVTSIGNGNSERSTDLVEDKSGKTPIKPHSTKSPDTTTPETNTPHDIIVEQIIPEVSDHWYLIANVTSAIAGDTVTLTYSSPIMQEGNYHHKIKTGSVKVNGTVISDFSKVCTDENATIYTTSFVMPNKTATVSATQATYYSVEIDDGISHGTISPSINEYEQGEQVPVTVTVTPDDGYKLKEDSLKWESTPIGETNGVYSFEISWSLCSSITLYAEFEQIEVYYNILIDDEQTGNIQAKALAKNGETVTITISPPTDYGYKINGIEVSGQTGRVTVSSTAEENKFTFVMPKEDVSISVNFLRKNKISHTVCLNGQINDLISEKSFSSDGERIFLIDYSDFVLTGELFTLTCQFANGLGIDYRSTTVDSKEGVISGCLYEVIKNCLTITLDEMPSTDINVSIFLQNDSSSRK